MKALLFVLMTCFGASVSAQETIFNVPNGEPTQTGHHYLQLQGTSEFPTNSTSLTYDYGVFPDFEVGFNVFDITNASPDQGGKSTDVLFNFQFFYEFDEFWKLSIGSQNGHSQEGRFASYTFLTLNHEFYKDAFIVVTLFEANPGYFEDASGFWQAGFEVPIISEVLVLEAEYVNGNSNISNGVIGFGWEFAEDLEITVGAQLAGFQSNNKDGIVVEFTSK